MKKDGGVGRFGKDYKVLGKNLDQKSFLLNGSQCLCCL